MLLDIRGFVVVNSKGRTFADWTRHNSVGTFTLCFCRETKDVGFSWTKVKPLSSLAAP
jgi:hypothetical protein